MQWDDRGGGCWEAVRERRRSVDAPTCRRKSPADRLGSDADFEMKIAHLLGSAVAGFNLICGMSHLKPSVVCYLDVGQVAGKQEDFSVKEKKSFLSTSRMLVQCENDEFFPW